MIHNVLLKLLSKNSTRNLFSLISNIKRNHINISKYFFHADPKIWVNENHPKIKLSFILRNGEKKVITVPKDITLLEAAQHEELDIEGACEASLACSTCHVILDKEIYDKLEPPSEREEDMLDMAPQVCETSRLACQVNVDEKISCGNIKLPNITRNFYVDGFKPSPH